MKKLIIGLLLITTLGIGLYVKHTNNKYYKVVNDVIDMQNLNMELIAENVEIKEAYENIKEIGNNLSRLQYAIPSSVSFNASYIHSNTTAEEVIEYHVEKAKSEGKNPIVVDNPAAYESGFERIVSVTTSQTITNIGITPFDYVSSPYIDSGMTAHLYITYHQLYNNINMCDELTANDVLIFKINEADLGSLQTLYWKDSDGIIRTRDLYFANSQEN